MAAKQEINDYIAHRIRRLRVDRGLRVQEISDRAGIPLGSYSCLETGRYRISLDNLFKITWALGASIGEVWPGDPPEAADRVDDQLIEQVLQGAKRREAARVSLDDVIRVVCDAYGVELVSLASPRRLSPLAEARAVAATLVKETPHLTLVELSRRLDRHVSSMSHAMRRLGERRAYDKRLDQRIEECRSALRSRAEAIRESPRNEA